MKKRILALLLTLCLAAALLPATVLAAEDAKTYLALGDSITTGYAPGGAAVAKPFADQVAAQYGYTLVNQAEDGETTASLLQKLEAQEIDLSGAALVTISIGGNDLIEVLYEALEAALTDAGAGDALLNGGSLDASVFETLAQALAGFAGSEACTDAVADAGANVLTILTHIQAENPDAKILLLNQYNPYSHLDNAMVSALVGAFDAGVNGLNTVLASVAQSAGVTVVDVYTPFRNAQENPCNAYFTSAADFELDYHPSQTGHDLIAETIAALLGEPDQTGDEETTAQTFTDVRPTDWYYEAVTFCSAQGLMSGVGNNAFDPNGSVTRAMVWTVLARIAGETISGADWMEASRTWAMTAGVSDGTDPTGFVTREQLATMLYRFAGSPEVTGDLSAYPDAGSVSDWAETALVWAVSTGLINGINGSLSPKTGASRAQLATMLMRQLQSQA